MTLPREIAEFKAPMFPMILFVEIYQGFDIDEFGMKYTVLARKIQKEIQTDDKLIRDFSTVEYKFSSINFNFFLKMSQKY